MKQIRRMIRSWDNNIKAHKLQFITNDPTTTFRLGGGGRKTMIDADTLLMIFKQFIIENAESSKTNLDLITLFEIHLEYTGKYAIQWIPTQSISKNVKSINVQQLAHQINQFKRRYNVKSNGDKLQTTANLESILLEWQHHHVVILHSDY